MPDRPAITETGEAVTAASPLGREFRSALETFLSSQRRALIEKEQLFSTEPLPSHCRLCGHPAGPSPHCARCGLLQIEG